LPNWWDKILGRGPQISVQPTGQDIIDEANAGRFAAASQSALTLPDEDKLIAALEQFPGVSIVGTGGDDQTWWVTFHLDLHLPTTLHVVHFLADTFNNTVSGNFPGAFYPKSPNAYLNPEIDIYLNWCIDVWSREMTTLKVVEMLNDAAQSFAWKVPGERSD
jgi:hypothetical protein